MGNARAKPIEGVLTCFFFIINIIPPKAAANFADSFCFFCLSLLLVAKRGPKDSVVAGVNFPVQQSSG